MTVVHCHIKIPKFVYLTSVFAPREGWTRLEPFCLCSVQEEKVEPYTKTVGETSERKGSTEVWDEERRLNSLTCVCVEKEPIGWSVCRVNE